jgi:protein-S-isoprenylcysteine O-methyltransferase Ste14
MDHLLSRIEKEVLCEKRKRQWMLVGQIAAGVSGILIVPALVIYLCTMYLPGFSFSFPKMHLNFDPNLIIIGFSILLLLVTDSLFRMHEANRTKRDL